MDDSPGVFESAPLSLQTTIPHVPQAGNARHKCDCHQLALDDRNDSFEKHFTEQMKEYGQTRGYKSVAAILLSWEGTDLQNTDDEIDKLHDVLRNQYHFSVTKVKIEKNKRASLSTLHSLVQFLMQHDSNNSLIIIYYAGHGMQRAVDGQFELSRTSFDDEKRRKLNSLIWAPIESQLLETEADLLVIFDCCYAGALARPHTRSPSRKIFSFVASTEADQTAIGPGADSFTSALIHSLHKLVDRNDGFSVMELLSEIMRAPYFKDTGQLPREGWRGGPPGDQRLKVRALPHAPNPELAAEAVADSATIDDVQYLLRLDFAFNEPLDQDHVSDFVSDLAHMIKTSQSPVKQVAWGFLARRTKRLHLRRFQEAAWHVRDVVRQRRLSSVSQLGLLGYSPSTDDFSHPGGSSSCGADEITALADSPPTLKPPSRKNSQSVHINRATDDKLNISFSFGQENKNSASTPFIFSFGESKQWSALISTALLAFAAGVCFMKGKAILPQGKGG